MDKNIPLLICPTYIAENGNGDICVSDVRAVVVTDAGGMLRFRYQGNTRGSNFDPYGICCDSWCTIIVADMKNDKIHVLDTEEAGSICSSKYRRRVFCFKKTCSFYLKLLPVDLLPLPSREQKRLENNMADDGGFTNVNVTLGNGKLVSVQVSPELFGHFTSSGSLQTWHGYADIILNQNIAVSLLECPSKEKNQCIETDDKFEEENLSDPIQIDKDEEAGPSSPKRICKDDNDNEEKETQSQQMIDRVIAQTITNAFSQVNFNDILLKKILIQQH
uniref:Uncharacterized protein n=1 Tax=Magallana gigas TaxID=29159 RepID=K1P9E2_MAGGI